MLELIYFKSIFLPPHPCSLPIAPPPPSPPPPPHSPSPHSCLPLCNLSIYLWQEAANAATYYRAFNCCYCHCQFTCWYKCPLHGCPQKTRILETVFQTPMDTAYSTQTAFIDNDINFLNIRCQIWVTLHDHSSIIKLWPVECSMFYVVLSLL